MADITDIKTILYTEKSLAQQEKGVIVVQTSTRVTKNQLKQIFIDFFGFTPIKINSLRQDGKRKDFKKASKNGTIRKEGYRVDFKKFYVKVPDGAKLDALNG